MELLDLVARTRRKVGVCICLEEGGEEGGFGDGELCSRHVDWVALGSGNGRRKRCRALQGIMGTFSRRR